ncbi:hypothetical protein HMPREF0201_02889 [Cedecea davisae DSM 4568]|uniref:Uncharacterized protein n=1 Tax=Cedecea davisae DSM 4568 TaxID=566551 RepID=S3JTQ7_9ENTR|nr:hypothetical protein HMPREF0201_02889 [Cedecea davisae DSM 4568]
MWCHLAISWSGSGHYDRKPFACRKRQMSGQADGDHSFDFSPLNG